ncbi:fumarylacetoacetate hydrolase family protein [Acrocarpospora macrocephala]|uniref:fumarylacetoacetate hydrolase family protein n=1 Tax=Acrocarpospora macrocephala TaxID=150177 RepID=UPI0012D2C6AF|nr:fumarylacetoacetate hydrolase family protein [Acrocarpospora macrocephala]
MIETLGEELFVSDCGRVDLDSPTTVQVETHVAFLLGQDLGDSAGVLEAAAAIYPALRITEPAGSGRAPLRTRHIVLGSASRTLARVGFDDMLVTVKSNGVILAAGEPADMWRPPVEALAWFAAEQAQDRNVLRRGTVVLSGSLHTPVAARPGDHVRGDLMGVGSVCVSLG